MRTLVNSSTGTVLIEKLFFRKSIFLRAIGLLFRHGLEINSGILLFCTRRIHTYGMLFPVDLYFFDSHLRLISKQSNVLPGHAPRSPFGTRHILEIQHRSPGNELRIEHGDRVLII
jgi:uncharacterized membrane protein (UPF0127 family)